MTLPVAGYREAFGYLWGPLRRRAGWVAVVIVAGIVAAVAGLAGPWVIGRLVDQLSEPRAIASTDVVWKGAAVVAVAAIVLFAATWVGRLALARVVEPAIADLREDVMTRALEIDSVEIERAGTGDLVSRVADDSRKIGESASQILPSFVESLFVVAISALGLAALDWRIGLVGLVAIPMYWLTLAWYLPRAEPRYTAERAAIGRRAGRLLGGLEGRATLRAYRRQDAELGRIHESSRHARDLSIGVFRFLTGAIGRNNRAEAVVLSLIIVAGFVLVWFGQLTTGAVTTAALVFHRLFNPIGALVGLFDQVMSAGASLTRMVGVILLPVAGTSPEPDPEANPEANPGHNLLSLDAVRFAYPRNAPVLRGIDLEVPSGHVVAVVGSTGSGKTTMAKLAAGILRPTSGEVLLAGCAMSALAPDELRRRVAMVSQEVHTFAASLGENVSMARPGANAAEIESALWRVGAEGLLALPDGIDTAVGEGGHRLTPMEEQLVALARVEIADPGLVVLDEATAEAGSAGARALERAAATVIEGRAALVVAHRLNQARIADTVLVVERGEIVESGSHDELVAAGGRYAELWSAWNLSMG